MSGSIKLEAQWTKGRACINNNLRLSMISWIFPVNK